MRRYELTEQSDVYFWEIELFDLHFEAREGVGAEVTRRREWFFRTPEGLRAEYRKHVDWRERAGFQLVRSDPVDDDVVNGWLLELRGDANPSLEGAIIEHPDDPDAWLVYGDWLESRGSARGELVQVQARLATDPTNASLREREATLMTDHERAWLGDLADYRESTFECRWRYGFVESATIQAGLEELREIHRMLAALPAARLLRQLDLRIWSPPADPLDEVSFSTLLDPRLVIDDAKGPANIVLSPILGELRVNADACRMRLDEAVASEMRQMTSLTFDVKRLCIEKVPASLRSLTIAMRESNDTLIMSDEAVGAALAHLETLSVTHRDARLLGTKPSGFLARALEVGMPNVTTLTIHVQSWGAEILHVLADRGEELFPHLVAIDLSGSGIDDEAARLLLDHRKAFERLGVIGLQFNDLSPTMCESLEASFGKRVQMMLLSQDTTPPWLYRDYDDY